MWIKFFSGQVSAGFLGWPLSQAMFFLVYLVHGNFNRYVNIFFVF
jgi:hypothetical protein